MQPIAPGEELLVWYNGEDNPEIAAAIEEERASSLSRKNSPRAKRARKKLLERAKQGGAEGFKGQQRSCDPEHAVTEMRESEDAKKQHCINYARIHLTASPEEPADVEQVPMKEETLLACVPEVLVEEEVEDEGEEEEEEEEEEELGKAPGDALPEDGGQASPRSEAAEAEEPPEAEASPQECEEEERAEKLPPESPSGSPVSKLDPDPDGDPQESFLFPCLHCERRFTTKQGLERHMHIHISANCQTHTFKCRYCGKAFGSQINRRRHERRHEARPKKNPSLPTESSSPDLVSSSGNFIIIGAQNGGDLQEPPEAGKQSPAMEAERSVVLDENGEPKEQHPCKYCKKVFGTHTNMRRHQRRIHERHLLPKGVRRKGMLPQEAPPQQPAAPPEESPNASPPPVYTPSGDPEDEGDPEEEYMVDISSNISENLSLYIDGKILSTSAVSTCEVIEVEPGSATLFGLDALIISPDKVTTALRVETASCAVKEVPNGGQTTKRRTATPPLLPKIKTEVESELITPSSSASSSSASSTSSVVGGLYPQATETLAFPKEKTVYLSPKLKQLLQTQDSHKPGLTLFTEAHRLGPPLTSVTTLPAASGRFKRRTASPPNSPQHSPAMRETGKTEAGASFGLKVPKLESHCSSPAWSLSSRDERDTLSPQGVDAFKTSPVDWSAGRSGGSSCNQQPLDLSSGVNKRSEGSNKGAGEAVLDLSMHRKPSPEPEVKGGAAQSLVKKKKPNTSMLEKVLMNEYGGLEVAVEENPGVLGSASALSANDPSLAASPAAPSPVSEAPSPGSVVPTALHPSPPSLTPVTMNPPSPSTSTLASPTPPPPVLPTAPSPLPAPTSPPPLPPSSPTPSSLPVLSPKNSPSPVSSSPGNPSPSPLDPSLGFVDSLPVVVNPDSGPVDPDVNPPEHSATSAGPAPPADVSISQVEIVPSKVDSLMPSEELSLTSEDPSGTTSSDQEEPQQETFCKNFVCNVCDEPFPSIKELSRHIVGHAEEWPFKCEFCVQLFRDAEALLEHRSTLHGVGRIYVCSTCAKEFAFLCNLKQHQKDLHPGQDCMHTEVENGKLRPQNYTDPARASLEPSPSTTATETSAEGSTLSSQDNPEALKAEELEEEEEDDLDDSTEELYTTIKIMASGGGKPKGPDVRLGINQHYPSFKPPPFPYHNRTPAGSVASATNFTTHNIPQTFSTAIRCTKCGKSFDNMPELHKHILACANASDKKRYTPKKNPIPLKQIVKPQNGVLSAVMGTNASGQNAFRRMGQPKRLNFSQEPSAKMKLNALNKKKNQLVQKAISQKNKIAASAKKASSLGQEEQEMHICPHCNREFTYLGSLNKHVAVSCPRKPPSKKVKKGSSGGLSSQDKNGNLRRRTADSEIKQQGSQAKLGKTRARTSGPTAPAAVPSKPPPGKVKAAPAQAQAQAQAQARPKRPAPFPAASVTYAKKSRPALKKELPPKKVPEAKLPLPPQPPQPPPPPPKKEERFSVKTRERVGGPVTRSLQLVSSTAQAEGKT
uniref:PR domain containing 2, with ZNF domain b n=1 Tax=Lepisosteus oculatus TaxID=7918 RepID=W5M0I5_LEPOC